MQLLPEDWAARAEVHESDLSHRHPVMARVYIHPVKPLAFDVHGEMEVGIVLSGREERVMSDTARSFGPGEVWLHSLWEPHGVRVPVPDTRVVLMMFLPEALGEELLGDLPWFSLFAVPPSRRPQVREERMRKRVLTLGERLAEEILEKPVGWERVVRLQLLELLHLLRREWNEAPEVLHSKAHIGRLVPLTPAMAAVYADLSKPLSLSVAARTCGLSRPAFCTTFREVMGSTFGQFERAARLAFAARLLLTSDLTGTAIAARTGFTDASHLHRRFVEHFGCTPADYRRTFRE